MTDALDPLDPSPYKVLNVPKDANLTTIRSAHRKLVLITHPDKVQDETAKKNKAEQFHQVQQAYEILSDENRRRRWDERSKLAELRAELAEERGPLRRAQTYAAPPRTTQGPIFEMRGGRVYEERIPKSARAYEDDAFSAAFAEAPRQARKYDDRYDETPSRKSSGRAPEERRKFMDVDEDAYERKAREKRQKEEVRTYQNEKQKQRDKARKKDTEAKFSSKKAYVEEDESDSDDYDDRHYSSKSDSKPKRKDTDRKRHRDEPPRRSSKKDTKAADPELDRKVYEIHDYMKKSGESVDNDRRRPGRSRADSYREHAQLPSPPLTPQDREFARRSSGDDGRRSSGRPRASRPPSPARKSNKNKKLEIVEPPPTRKPSLPTGGSERSGLKDKMASFAKREPHRAATFTPETKPSRKPGIQRAETMPIDQMRQERDPRVSSSSKLRTQQNANTFDVSDSSSDTDSTTDSEPETILPSNKKAPPQPTPPPVRRSYKIGGEEQGRGPRIINASPEDIHRSSRDVSPKNPRRSGGDRYSGSTRPPPPRSSTFQERPSARHSESSRNVPPLKTSYSSRDRPPLFNEIFEDDHSPKSQHGSPRNSYADERMRSGYPRRGSEDVDRDAYPGSMNKHRGRHHGSREIYA